jgi:phosphoribosyl 1,2-cyclic phosphate phosphodiesterase
MRLTFLGTGTSYGIPMLGCDCSVCRSDDPRNKRLRPSILVEQGDRRVLVDVPPDFRTQALREGLRQLDAVLLTHSHADHMLGMDDLRAFTERNGGRMPVYGSVETLTEVRRVFAYACTEKLIWQWLPRFELRTLEPWAKTDLGSGLDVCSLPLAHASMTVFGFLFGQHDLAYLTDCNAVPEKALAALRGVKVLVIDALRHRPHPSHFTVAEALAIIEQIKPGTAYLTHMSHELDHAQTQASLPDWVQMAYDGLRVEIDSGRGGR